MMDQAGFQRTGREVALRAPLDEATIRSLKVGDVVLISGPRLHGPRRRAPSPRWSTSRRSICAAA